MKFLFEKLLSTNKACAKKKYLTSVLSYSIT